MACTSKRGEEVVHYVTMFGRDVTRHDGLQASCRKSRAAHARQVYKKNGRPGRAKKV